MISRAPDWGGRFVEAGQGFPGVLSGSWTFFLAPGWYAHDAWETLLQLAWPDLHDERTKKDIYRCVTWRRGGAPQDLTPVTNDRDIRPSTHWQNQPMQSHHIDVKHELGEPRFGILQSPQESKERSLQNTHVSPMVSKYSLHKRRGTQMVSILSYSTLHVINRDYMKYL
jgi:hypothetical protein